MRPLFGALPVRVNIPYLHYNWQLEFIVPNLKDKPERNKNCRLEAGVGITMSIYHYAKNTPVGGFTRYPGWGDNAARRLRFLVLEVLVVAVADHLAGFAAALCPADHAAFLHDVDQAGSAGIADA